MCVFVCVQNKSKPKTDDGWTLAPATPAIKYKNLVGSAGLASLHDTTPYQGPPSEANNALWEDLYQCKLCYHGNLGQMGTNRRCYIVGITRIPMSEAAQLENRTVPIANDPGYYAVTIDVFHQLHCLVRQIFLLY